MRDIRRAREGPERAFSPLENLSEKWREFCPPKPALGKNGERSVPQSLRAFHPPKPCVENWRAFCPPKTRFGNPQAHRKHVSKIGESFVILKPTENIFSKIGESFVLLKLTENMFSKIGESFVLPNPHRGLSRNSYGTNDQTSPFRCYGDIKGWQEFSGNMQE